MNIVLLSGGSGKRLWPLSNDVRSKQFIKFFRNEDGSYESMLQRVYRQICAVDPDASVTIATSRAQISTIHNQLGDKAQISLEPCRRDTFPAIALASAYLRDVQGVGEDEVVIVCPVDPYVERDYFEALKKLEELAKRGTANLTLMGIEPTYPSEKYGYIIPENCDDVSRVEIFKEKPDTETAKSYIDRGALWNGGIFAYRLGYVLRKAHEMIDFEDYQDLFSKYDTLEKISFDYAVVEKEEEIEVMRFSGMWKDLGTWNALSEVMEDDCIGQAILDGTCENVHVVNELGMPVLCMGMRDVVVAASQQGILVSDLDQTDFLKSHVDQINQEIMFAEKSWGSYLVLDASEHSLTVRVTLRAGQRMNYHSHEHRNEVWTILSGKGKTIVDGMEQQVKAGDVITMEAGCRHTIIAETEMHVIEIQMGQEISVHDKRKYELEI